MKQWDIIPQQPKLKHIRKPATDCLLQEGKIWDQYIFRSLKPITDHSGEKIHM